MVGRGGGRVEEEFPLYRQIYPIHYWALRSSFGDGAKGDGTELLSLLPLGVP